MKKIIIAAICSAIAVSGFAQGTVQFQNAFGTRIFLQAYDGAGNVTGSNAVTSATLGSQPGSGTTNSSGVLDVALLWGTSAGTATTLAGIENIDPSLPGQLLGNAVFSFGGTSSANEAVYISVVAWDSSYGNSLVGLAADIAAGGYFGSFGSTGYGQIGAALPFTLGATAGPGTQVFGTLAGQIGKFNVGILSTPEPTTIALGGLGAAALLLFRRRK